MLIHIQTIVFFISLVAVVIFFKPLSKFLFRVGIRGTDQQKAAKPLLPTSAGLIVIVGFLAGIFFYIGFNTFVLHEEANLAILFAASFSIIIITFIGFFDDINISPTMKLDKGVRDIRIGLKQWQKPLLVLPAALPLMAVKAGVTQMTIPFVGAVNLGILYPLLIIPIAVIFVANATNMLAGMNGMEAGLGFLTTISMGIYASIFGQTEAAIISFAAAGALLAILFFNWYPAKILPGDSLTFLIGASIVSAMVIGNMEKFAMLIFTPWIIEFFLKMRLKFKARSLGDLQLNGTLKAPYKKIYSWTHIWMRLGVNTEKKIALSMILLEIILIIISAWFSFLQATAIIR